jgi:hypothetical protein
MANSEKQIHVLGYPGIALSMLPFISNENNYWEYLMTNLYTLSDDTWRRNNMCFQNLEKLEVQLLRNRIMKLNKSIRNNQDNILKDQYTLNLKMNKKYDVDFIKALITENLQFLPIKGLYIYYISKANPLERSILNTWLDNHAPPKLKNIYLHG